MSATDICQQCKLSKQVLPTLKLLYSTCCGLELCSTCVNQLSSRQHTKCIGCGANITNRDFTTETLEAQLYNKELQVKQRLSTIFILHRIDFSTDIEYENYNEFCTDIIYDIVYGNKQSADAAEQRVIQWKHDNQTKIDLAVKRQQSALKQANKKHDKQDKSHTDTTEQLNTQKQLNFTLPSVKSDKHSLYMSKHDEQAELQRINAITDITQRKKQLNEFYTNKKQIEEKASIAGGLNLQDNVNRSLNEAMYGLLDVD